jgi:hypothetical protein
MLLVLGGMRMGMRVRLRVPLIVRMPLLNVLILLLLPDFLILMLMWVQGILLNVVPGMERMVMRLQEILIQSCRVSSRRLVIRMHSKSGHCS